MTAPAQNIRENRRLRAVFPCCRQKGFVMGDSGKMAYRAVFPFFPQTGRPAFFRPPFSGKWNLAKT
ncbi:hypothetical protein B4135_0164 [Caldibacillus debilis]|uniref:Uncharacterized protein n=1 Tax=Caldibacillus debilis TaxID=301148 RepID=A0A150LVF0_9BACI|nr:hypothetical protein B4135_0164 [Caldibacillus debilis]